MPVYFHEEFDKERKSYERLPLFLQMRNNIKKQYHVICPSIISIYILCNSSLITPPPLPKVWWREQKGGADCAIFTCLQDS